MTEPPLFTIRGRKIPIYFDEVIVGMSCGPSVGSSGKPEITAERKSLLIVEPRSLVACNLNLTFKPLSAGGMAKVCSNKNGLLATVKASMFTVKSPLAPSSRYTA